MNIRETKKYDALKKQIDKPKRRSQVRIVISGLPTAQSSARFNGPEKADFLNSATQQNVAEADIQRVIGQRSVVTPLTSTMRRSFKNALSLAILNLE